LKPFRAVVLFGLVVGACKSRSTEQMVAYRSDAAVRRGMVKNDKEGMRFEPDETLAKTAADASQNAVKLAKQSFDVVLDWSDSSIGDLERVLDLYYYRVIVRDDVFK
jgi:hypothetical protein